MNWRHDHHFQWVKVGVAGWCDDGNIEAMSTAIEQMPHGAIVEIGSFVGRSTCVISRLIELSAKEVDFFSVDDWYFEGYRSDLKVSPYVSGDSWRAYTEASFRANIDYFTRRRPRHIKERSNRFFELWAKGAKVRDLFRRRVLLGGPIAFAFIDGDHSYAACKSDFENVDRFLLPGGFVLFDDSYEGTPHESRLVAAEALKLPHFQLVGRYPNLLVRKRTLDESKQHA